MKINLIIKDGHCYGWSVNSMAVPSTPYEISISDFEILSNGGVINEPLTNPVTVTPSPEWTEEQQAIGQRKAVYRLLKAGTATNTQIQSALASIISYLYKNIIE
jgi:hypothetical protein